MENGNLQIKLERRFVLADLPAPLTRASEHLQFFDNYITATRLWLRRVRDPATKEWQRYFVQQYAPDSNLAQTMFAHLNLNEYEYKVLSVFESNELRYNRYSLEIDSKKIWFDVFLNRELWNLIVAVVEFDSAEEMGKFVVPSFFNVEITFNENLTAQKLTALTLAEVQKYVDLNLSST